MEVAPPDETPKGERLMVGVTRTQTRRLRFRAPDIHIDTVAPIRRGDPDRIPRKRGLSVRDLYRVSTQLQSLVYLRLYVSRIARDGLACLQHLRSLETLDLGFDLCYPNLLPIGKLHVTLGTLILRFSRNEDEVDEAHRENTYRHEWGIGKSVAPLTRLHTLKLGYNYETNADDPSLLSLSDDIHRLPPSLTCIDTFMVDEDSVDVEDGEEKANDKGWESLSSTRFPKLSTLRLSFSVQLEKLVELLNRCPALTNVAFGEVKPTDSLFLQLPSLLSSSSSTSFYSSSLRSLTVTENPGSASAFVCCLCAFRGLQTLRWKIDDDGELFTLFKRYSSIRAPELVHLDLHIDITFVPPQSSLPPQPPRPPQMSSNITTTTTTNNTVHKTNTSVEFDAPNLTELSLHNDDTVLTSLLPFTNLKVLRLFDFQSSSLPVLPQITVLEFYEDSTDFEEDKIPLFIERCSVDYPRLLHISVFTYTNTYLITRPTLHDAFITTTMKKRRNEKKTFV